MEITIPPNDIAQTLAPLASLAIQSACKIPGLAEILQKYGWTGKHFETPLQVSEFRNDLWRLYEAKKSQQLFNTLVGHVPRCLATPALERAPFWNSEHPLKSFVAQIEYLQFETLTYGALWGELTYAAQMAIIDSGKMGLECEMFKKVLQRHGWCINLYAFRHLPDLSRLVQDLRMQ